MLIAEPMTPLLLPLMTTPPRGPTVTTALTPSLTSRALPVPLLEISRAAPEAPASVVIVSAATVEPAAVEMATEPLASMTRIVLRLS